MLDSIVICIISISCHMHSMSLERSSKVSVYQLIHAITKTKSYHDDKGIHINIVLKLHVHGTP